MRQLKILFVCHGNICRSPMAEFCMKKIVNEAGYGNDFIISSAAMTDEEEGNPVYRPVRKILNDEGIDCSNKRARQMTRDDYRHFDLIIGMDEENREDLMRLSGGDPDGKISLLLEHATADNKSTRSREVADPWYTRDFETSWRDIEQGCRDLLSELIS